MDQNYGLEVTENQDGTFTLQWDENDTRWSWLNALSEEEATKILTDAIESYLDELKQKENQP